MFATRYIKPALISALVLGLLGPSLVASAKGPGPSVCKIGRRPGHGRLPAGQPTVDLVSFNGIQWRAPTPTRVRPSRSRDPMAVVVRQGVQPDSELSIEVQDQSKALGKKLCGAGCYDGLQKLSGEAVVWKSVQGLSVKPQVASVNDADTTIFRNREQVLLPNTRARITGQTRDGRPYQPVHTVVQGQPDTNESRWNFETNRQENVRISGRFLPSARVWTQPANLLISQPVRDVATMGQGKSMLKAAARRQRTAKMLQTRITKLQTKLQDASNYKDTAKLNVAQQMQRDQNILAKLQQAIPTIQQKATQLETQGKSLLDQGRVLRSIVVSVGALPNAASVSLANPRLQGERQPMSAVNGVADASNGYLKTEIGGIHKDLVTMTVSYPATNGAKSSTMTTEMRIPDPRSSSAQPVLRMGGKRHPVKFYQANPVEISRIDEPADPR